MGERYSILRFGISSKDFLSIVGSRAFVKLGHIGYYNGCVNYGMSWDIGRTLVLYASRRTEPAWFDLKDWKNPAAYIMEQEAVGSWYKARLLIHNEERNAAYFVEYEVRGHWDRHPVAVTGAGKTEIPAWVEQQMEDRKKMWEEERNHVLN